VFAARRTEGKKETLLIKVFPLVF